MNGLIAKYRGMNIQLKASLWYAICNVLQKGISFIVIPIYVRVLTTAEYGVYSVFQSWRDILIIFATLNLYCGVFTKAMVDYDDDRDRYTSCMQGLSTLITLAMFGVYWLLPGTFNAMFSMDTVTMVLLFAYFLFFPSFNFWSVRKKVENKYISMVIVTMLVSVATPAISLALLFFTDLREQAVIWGYLLVNCAVGAVFYVQQFIRGKVFFHKDYWLHGIQFNIPLIPHYLSMIVLGQSDRIMIQKMCGESQAGIYSFSYQIAMVLNIIINAVNGSFVPWFYGAMKEKNYSATRRVSNQLCFMMGLMVLAASIVAPEIVTVLGTEDYREALWIIPSVSLSVFFTFLYSTFCNVQFYYSRTKFVMVASLVGAVLKIVLNLIFIPIFGYISAGYTTAVCYFVFMLMHYIFMRHICKQEKISEPVFDLKFIGALTVGLSAACLGLMALYPLYIVRYILVAVLLVVLFLKRDMLMAMFKRGNTQEG